ncbi:MAG: FTR1 family protein [Candidatus Heimdallarchaeota archaeon]|nr:FTR1 family protein [Candidatus Heimdallarchaeota archaeon]MBY8996004.1 FTR1 family protein [Candidatus Heimdallarchaeota archaeon]
MRESIEAALIIGILLTYLSKVGHKELRKDIWLGTIAAILTSVGAAMLFYFVLGGFEQYEKIIEGFAMIIAAIILTWVIIWMMKTGKDIKGKLEDRIEQTISKEKRFGLIFLAFISVFREGIETVLFMVGVVTVETNVWAIIGSSIAGIAVSVVIGIALFWSGQKINLKYFFNITSIILIIFAAGLFAHGLHEFQEIGWFGSEDFFLQRTVWDMSAFLNDKTTELGKFLRALVGYQDKPTWLELISYVTYIVGASIGIILIRRPGRKEKQELQVETEEITLEESIDGLSSEKPSEIIAKVNC